MTLPQNHPRNHGVSPVPAPETAAPLAPVGPPRHPLRLTTVAAVGLALVVLFGLVGFQALIVRHQSTLDDLDGRIAAATTTNQRLRLDVAELEAPERIRAVALLQLGMIEPEVVTYLEPIPASELGLTSGEAEPGTAEGTGR